MKNNVSRAKFGDPVFTSVLFLTATILINISGIWKYLGFQKLQEINELIPYLVILVSFLINNWYFTANKRYERILEKYAKLNYQLKDLSFIGTMIYLGITLFLLLL